MAKPYIPDEILQNILSRIHAKPLLRLRCVSTHWNRLISDPCFMKSRSRRMILFPHAGPVADYFPIGRSLAIIDDNVPVDDKTHSTVRIPSPVENPDRVVNINILGTFDGIVLLAFTDTNYRVRLILYNPLTCASKILSVMDRPSRLHIIPYAFGFGFDETTHELKLVRLWPINPERQQYVCDIFDPKTSSWSRLPQKLEPFYFFWCNVGVFLNGFLYWLILVPNLKILAYDTKKMAFSFINLPHRSNYRGSHLGSLNGSLCFITKTERYSTIFDVWVMKEHGDGDSWFKSHSFTFGLEGDCLNEFHPICILGNSKILIANASNQLVIYDTSNDSYKMHNGLASHDNIKAFNVSEHFERIRSMEYVESLISPSDIYFT